ncbi:MAG: ATP-binding protein [Leptothrix sp. (in: b-proteobacteria)]
MHVPKLQRLPKLPKFPDWAPYVLVVALIVASVVSLAVLDFWQERQRYRERATVATQNIAQLIDQHVSDVFDKIDICLQSAALYYREEAVEGQIDPIRINNYLVTRQALQPDVVGLRIIDKKGWVRFGAGLDSGRPVNLADRDFFMRARDDANAGLVVYGPVFGRIAKQWVIVFARRISLPDGSFGGVVYANFAITRFEDAFSLVRLGPHGAITIRGADLALVQRFPGTQNAIGSKEVSKQLRDIMAASSESGVYIATTALDGIERSNAYRKLPHYPFYVIVGLATEDYLGGWKTNVLMLSGLAGLAILATCLGAILVYCSTRRLAADIDKRKRLEAQLAASVREFRDLYDQAPCGYHSLDADGKYVQINATALAWIGYERDEVIGKKGLFEFLTATGQAQFPENFQKIKNEGLVDGLEFELRHKNGSSRWVRVTANAVCDAAGNFLMTRSVLYDITAVRQLEAQAYKLLREQAAMLDNELIAVVKLRNRRALWHNKGIQKIFGYTPDEFHGESSRVFYPDDASYLALGAAAYPVLRGGGTYRCQIEMVHKNGQRLWIDLSGVLFSAEADESLWLLMDITALKQAEAARVQSIQLEAENRQLSEASRLKSLFLANMSHELRTPLNAVIGFVSLLQAGVVRPDTPKFGIYLNQIGASGKHLLQLIDSMLDFAKAGAEKFELKPEPVHLPALVQDVLDSLDAGIKQKQIEVTTRLDASVADLVLDPLRLKQVLANYLSNAIKFTPERGHVTVSARAEGTEQVRIEVADTGIGIAAADLPRLFTEFQQLSVGTTKTHPGIGLGLALTRRLVEAQGGTVGVSSMAGEGSVFWLLLPQVAAAQADPPH